VPLGDVQQGKKGDEEHSVNTVSTLVDQLIDLGMLLRDTDPDDRRAARMWCEGLSKATGSSYFPNAQFPYRSYDTLGQLIGSPGPAPPLKGRYQHGSAPGPFFRSDQ
jgi:hypothetical protein